MKIIIDDNGTPIVEVNKRHFIVAIVQGAPCIAVKGFHEPDDAYSFKSLRSGFTYGNGWDYRNGMEKSGRTLEDLIKTVIEKGEPVEAFDNWKDAFFWLLCNENVRK